MTMDHLCHIWAARPSPRRILSLCELRRMAEGRDRKMHRLLVTICWEVTRKKAGQTFGLERTSLGQGPRAALKELGLLWPVKQVLDG